MRFSYTINKDPIAFNCTDSFWPLTCKKIQNGAHASVQIKTIIPLDNNSVERCSLDLSGERTEHDFNVFHQSLKNVYINLSLYFPFTVRSFLLSL